MQMRFPAFSIAYLKAALTGFFVRITGDTMNGALNIISPTLGALNIGNASSFQRITNDLACLQNASGTATRLSITGDGAAGSTISQRFSNDAISAAFSIVKSRGTAASPTQVLANDEIGRFAYFAYDNSATPTIRDVAQLSAIAISNITNASSEGRLIVYTTPNGSTTLTENARWDQATGYNMYGANVVIDANRVYRNRIFTVATLPAGVQGMRTMVSDALAPAFNAAVVGGGAVTIPVFYTGAAWNVG